MVHLSVAIGRFFEALLFALARGVGVIAAAILVGLIAAGVLAFGLRAIWRRR